MFCFIHVSLWPLEGTGKESRRESWIQDQRGVAGAQRVVPPELSK